MRSLWLLLMAVALLLACDPARPNRQSEIARNTGGNAKAGKEKMRAYGCPACHTIPGIQGNALVGPPLISWSKRVYIAGEVPNTPSNLMKWIQHPTSIEPKTAMPEMGVTDQDSRDIAAYLYSLN
ncbi:MAG TPA: c-type cytochrome [Terriglobales bacterium]|nr:c-type cytochrome [Terriglobales bacterium]